MELLDGELLAARMMREPRLTLVEMVEVTRQLCDALEIVHDAGLIHRDVKPSNIFLVQERGQLRVKLLDFGVAKRLGPEVARTAPGALLGTPVYMSPEQCRGEPSIDRRADVYSIGAVLFEMATGRPPFTHKSIAELIEAHMYQAPPSLAELAPQLPPVVGQVVACALAKLPNDRFPCAMALAKALGDALQPAEETYRDRPPTRPMQTAVPINDTIVDGVMAPVLVERKRMPTLSYEERPARANANANVVAAQPPVPLTPPVQPTPVTRAPTTRLVSMVATPLPAPTRQIQQLRAPRTRLVVICAVGVAVGVVGVLLALVAWRASSTRAASLPSVAAPAAPANANANANVVAAPTAAAPPAALNPPAAAIDPDPPVAAPPKSKPPAHHHAAEPPVAAVVANPRPTPAGLLNPFSE